MSDERTLTSDVRGSAGRDGRRVLPPETPQTRRRWRGIFLIGGGLVVAAGAAVVAGAFLLRSDGGSSGGGETAVATAEVAVRDLVQSYRVSGTLGYADARSAINYRQGTITGLPREGRVVRRGQVLYRVDERPVFLLYGAQPAWRPLAEGVSDGRDVLQLERNLRALGYDQDREMTIDRQFDANTEAAVERWQEDIGFEETGVVELGDMIFLPGRRRIGALGASVGDRAAPGSPIMETTSTGRVITGEIDASDQGDIRVGDRVTIDLLNDTTTRGTIIEVGKIATTSSETETGAEGAAGGQAADSSTITFEVRPNDPDVVGRLDQAPVEMQVADQKAADVLSVPVTALLALRGGGHAVETLRTGVPALVAVQPGLYSDDGFVAISGNVEAGDQVVVPE